MGRKGRAEAHCADACPTPAGRKSPLRAESEANGGEGAGGKADGGGDGGAGGCCATTHRSRPARNGEVAGLCTAVANSVRPFASPDRGDSEKAAHRHSSAKRGEPRSQSEQGRQDAEMRSREAKGRTGKTRAKDGHKTGTRLGHP